MAKTAMKQFVLSVYADGSVKITKTLQVEEL